MLCKHFEGNVPRGGIAGSYRCSVLADIVKQFSKAVLTLEKHVRGHILEDSEQYLSPQLHELENYYCSFSGRINQDWCMSLDLCLLYFMIHNNQVFKNHWSFLKLLPCARCCSKRPCHPHYSPLRQAFLLFHVSGEAAATQTDDITGPGPQKLKQQPDSEAWLFTLLCKYAPGFPFQCSLSLFQKPLLQPSERSKIHSHISLEMPTWASWNLCLCISGKNKWAATLKKSALTSLVSVGLAGSYTGSVLAHSGISVTLAEQN